MYQLCHSSSKRLEDNWHSGLLFSTKHRLLRGAHPNAAELCRGKVPYCTSCATFHLSA